MAKASGFLKLLKGVGKGATNLGAGSVNLGAKMAGGGVDLAKGGLKLGGKVVNKIDKSVMEPLSKKLVRLLGLPDAAKVGKNGKVKKLKLKGDALKRMKNFKKLEKEMPQVAKLINMIRANGAGIRKTGLVGGGIVGGAGAYDSLINQPDSQEMM